MTFKFFCVLLYCNQELYVSSISAAVVFSDWVVQMMHSQYVG